MVQKKQDGQALRQQALAPKIDTIDGQLTDTNLKTRRLYSALTQFANCLKVALQSATYFDDKSFDDKRDLYKRP